MPGLSIVASEDGIVPPQATYADWVTWRSIDAPHALLVDWGTSHYDTRKGQSWETAWYWIGEAVRQRYPDTSPLSPAPGELPLLRPLDYAEGWLAETPRLTIADPPPAGAPEEVEIASLTDGVFTAPHSTGSWVPSQGAAMVYRAFGSADGVSRSLNPLQPRQSPLYLLLDPVHDTDDYDTPLFQMGETVAITAEMNLRDQFNHGIYIDSVDFYLGDQLIGTDLSDGCNELFCDNRWTVEATFSTPGIHALIAVGHTDSGRSYSTFRTVLVAAPVPEPTSATSAICGAMLLVLLGGPIARPIPQC